MIDGYQWTTDDDEIALDAVVVGIRGTSSDVPAAGTHSIEPTACIYWSAWFGPEGQIVNADGEPGPWEVLVALDRAEQFRIQFGFKRVVVAMKDRDTWREEWGTLAVLEGYS